MSSRQLDHPSLSLVYNTWTSTNNLMPILQSWVLHGRVPALEFSSEHVPMTMSVKHSSSSFGKNSYLATSESTPSTIIRVRTLVRLLFVSDRTSTICSFMLLLDNVHKFHFPSKQQESQSREDSSK